LHLINISDAGSECEVGLLEKSVVNNVRRARARASAGDARTGTAFSIDDHFWGAASLNVEIEPEVPPGYPLSDLAGRCL
jgi:hypothetical protein